MFALPVMMYFFRCM